MPAGRPSIYTNEIAERICETLSKNGSIRQTAIDCGIDRTTISNWAEKHEEFSAAIARAKHEGYAARAEQAVSEAKTAEDAAKGRLAFDAERWLLSKLDPKRFGDKLQHADADGDKLPAGFNVTLVKPVT